LVVPPNTNLIKLQVTIEGSYKSYQGELQTADGDLVLKQTALRPVRTKSGDLVVVQISAARFTKRDHVLKLRGVAAGGVLEDAGQYSFRIIKN
jgi:hypothetical protein